jgi:hypothetical protein
MTTSTALPPQGSTTAILVPITDINALKAAGIHYPATVEGWRWAYRMRTDRGLDHAFIRHGRRVLVDIPAYLKAVRTQAGAA